jgi:hypothetical protein
MGYLRKGETYTDLACGFEIGTSTVYRYIREALDLLATTGNGPGAGGTGLTARAGWSCRYSSACAIGVTDRHWRPGPGVTGVRLLCTCWSNGLTAGDE